MNRIGPCIEESPGMGVRDSGYDYRLIILGKSLRDFKNLGGSFPFSVNDLGETGSEAPVVVYSRVTQVLKGQIAKTVGGGGRGQFSRLNLLEKIKKNFRIHGSKAMGSGF
jgi:hypothetical protein